MKECFFFLYFLQNSKINFFSCFCLKLWFSGSDTSGFHFFLFLGVCPFFMFSRFFKLSRNCNSYITLLTFKLMKFLQVLIVVFYVFDTSFSKKLIEFFNFVFNCRFYFVLLVVTNFPNNELVSLAPHGRTDDTNTF